MVTGEEPHRSWRIEKRRDADVCPLLRLDRHAEPDIRQRPSIDISDQRRVTPPAREQEHCAPEFFAAYQRPHPSMPFRQHLKGVHRCACHHREHLGDELVGISLWNRSDMELTKTLRGFRQPHGLFSRSGCNVTVSNEPGPLNRSCIVFA